MTLYTWRALSRGWREPNWRILKFWAPLFALAVGIIILIAVLAAPLPRWLTFVIGIPLGVASLQGGAWLAGATRKPDMVDRIEAGEKPSLAEMLEDLTGPREFLPTIPGTQMEWSGPPPRKHPCWRCLTYRRWPRDRRHFGCASVKIPEAQYIWLPERRDQD